MKEKEVQVMGARILEALGLAGKKESLSNDIEEQSLRISENNDKVAELKAVKDADSSVATENIEKLSKELDEITKELDSRVESLKKEGYTLPIGSKKSRNISL